MVSNTFKVAEARARFSALLERARSGEEIVITRGREPQARIVPLPEAEGREPAPLEHLCLPDDLFDRDDAEQAAMDAGDCGDEPGIWRGSPTVS